MTTGVRDRPQGTSSGNAASVWTTPDAATAGLRVECPDLRAVVFPGHVPEGAAEELPTLYNTLLSTQDWFEAQDDVKPTGACILEAPHHVILFHVTGDTIEVLNKEFGIGPRSAERACRALFRAVPSARRIHLEVLFPPWEFRLPKRILYWTDHMIVDLPDTVDAYLASLGKRTRHRVRMNWRRLLEAHPDTTVEMVASPDDMEELIESFVAWKNQRFNARGEQTVWQQDPRAQAGFTELVRRRGRIRVMRIDGRAAAVDFTFPVGESVYGLQSAFDPTYEDFSLGFLDTFEVIADAIRTGHRQMSLLWGQEEQKRHFGAKPRRATRLSVFRRQADRLYSLDEGWEVAWRNLRRNGQREYWRLRHAAGRRVKVLAKRAVDTPPGDESPG